MATLPLSPEAETKMVAAIHHGVHAHVAASLAGIPRADFAAWLRRGRRARHGLYRAFYLLIEQARAEVRARAEMDVYAGHLRDWLRHGPGKDDWSARSRPNDDEQSLLANREFNRLVSQLLRLLEAHPEAQQTLKQAFRRESASRGRKPPKEA